ncbi:MAG: DUF6049 family protein [Microthrixaceae bacterium]
MAFDPSGFPAGSTLRATIRQRLDDRGSLRDATAEQLGGATPPRDLQSPITVPIDSLPADGTARVLSIPIRSDSGGPERQLVPNAGVHPVTLEVLGPTGSPLATATVYLNRLPEETPLGRDGSAATTTVQLLAGLDSGIALGPDGRFAASAEERVALQAWRTMLGSNLEIPLTVALRPNTLLGLQRSGDPLDEAFVEDLSSSAFVAARQTYVRVDTAGLAERDLSALQRQLARGSLILAELTGSAPSGPWMLDDTIDTATAGLLASESTEQFLVSEDRLAPTGDDLSPEARSRLLRTRSLELDGVPGALVSSYDVGLTELLLEPGVPAGLRAHHVATALMASWFDALADAPGAFPGVSSAILLYPGTDHEVLETLVGSLGEDGPLRLDAPAAPSADTEGRPLRARLTRRATEVPTGVVRRWSATDERIGGFDSMTAPADTSTVEWALLNDQTPGSAASEQTRAALWNHVDTAIEERVAQIQTPPPRTVVLTSRSGSIPIRIRNRGAEPLTVRLAMRSPRLDFPDGPLLDVLLAPGENRVDIPVEVRAPGSSLLRVELSSPDEVIEIREVQVTVRSSSISGVGAVLSVVSLLVLAIWWLRTHLQRRGTGVGTAGTLP